MEAKLKGKRIAIYARYSSDRQRETSIEDQVRRCREHIEREGGAVVDGLVFTDCAISGASLARTGFESLMALVTAKPPTVDVIVTEDVSRVTRDLADGAALFKKLQFVGVPLIGVADGINTGSKHAKLTYTVKNLVADIYLDDLRDKTLRGLEGRHLAGFSTGNPPYGYRSIEVKGADGKIVGHRLEVDPEKAAVVRRVFALYLDGHSLSGIAKLLCSEGVSPPRAHTRHRRKGWVETTIRTFLHNEKYVGVWRYKEREWAHVPGENRRAPRLRPAAEVMEQLRPELRIIDEDTWVGVQARLAAVLRHYTRTADGRPKGRAVQGRATGHLLSGLMYCGTCGAPMIIWGGGSSKYYRCPDHVKRGTCTNGLGVRESVARTSILDAIRGRLFSPAGIAYARKRIAERLGELARGMNAEVQERSKRLARTEARIAGLVQFIADGERSESIVSGLHDLEAQAKAERATIAAIEERAATPIRLPSPAEVEQLVCDLEARIAQDPLRAREELRRLLKDGRIVLEPQPDRVYLARTSLLPLVLLADPQITNRRFGGSEAAVSREGSGGKI